MKNMRIARLLMIVTLILLISVPLCVMMKSEAGAGETSDTITSYNEDYVFFVIEENKTPLAAVPLTAHTANYSVILIIALAFTAIAGFGYSVWFAGTKSRIDNLIQFLPQSIRNSLSSQLSIFHPIKAYQLSRETEYDVANMFFRV